MIAGIGVDIVDVARIQALLDRYGERFLARVYTEAEAAYAMGGANRAERLAGRFAVKEAVMKALGTGKSQGILWRDVETLRGRLGKPEVRLHGQAGTHSSHALHRSKSISIRPVAVALTSLVMLLRCSRAASTPLRSRPSTARCDSARRNLCLAPYAAPLPDHVAPWGTPAAVQTGGTSWNPPLRPSQRRELCLYSYFGLNSK